MADEAVSRPVKSNKKKGLPPLSPREEDETGDTTRPVRRKKKKAAQAAENPKENGTDAANEREKPTPRRRRKRSPSQTKATDEQLPAADSSAAPKKKKKKPKANTEEGADQNQSAEPLQSQRESQGSKTSLLSKDAAPGGKKTGKKKKKVRKTPQGDDYGESPWAEDLRTIEDDIITDDRGDGDGEEEEGDRKKVTTFVTAPILRSQPLGKIFIETSTKFKGLDKKALTKQQVEKTISDNIITEAPKMTTADFAILTNKVFRVITLFLHGLSAGLALWQLAIVYILASFPSDDFFQHYYRIAMPLQGSLYFLLVVCAVSAFDRFDISRPSRRFILRALTLQNGAVSVIFCLAAVVLNVVAIRYEDRMSLYKDYKDLYTDDNMRASEIDSFRSLNAARSVMAVLSWFVISITPNTDRLGMSLKSGKTGLEMELDQISSA